MNYKLHVEAHLTDDLLIRLLDRELDKRASEAAERHLDCCWTCRSKREEMRLAMDRFVRLEEALIDASITTPPRAWAGFRDKLAAVAQAPPPRKQLPRQLTHALGVIGAALAIAFWLMPPASVSAMEILERSAASEQPLLKGRPNPVVLQRLRVQSAHRAASWSVWNAPRARKFLETWDAPGNGLRADLERIYTANGLDMKHPLSAVNHARWRHLLREHHDSVVQQGELLEVVTTNRDRVQPGEIAEAELWVRRSDWHPVRQTFRVAEAGATQEYQIVETAFHVEALDAENARIFDPAPPSVETAAPVRMRSSISAVDSGNSPTVFAPAETELIETEIDTLALLHEMDADRQDSAEVTRTATQVRVTAYTSSEDRKLELESHLSAIPLVTYDIHLLGDSAAAPLSGDPVPVAVASSSASESPLFLKPLVQQTGSLEVANRIVSDQMDLLRRLCIELDAVKRLGTRFPADTRESLSPRSLRVLDGLALDHLDAARHVWLELEQNAVPLLAAAGVSEKPDAGSVASCGEWYRSQSLAADSAQRLEDLYARAFIALAGAPSDISEAEIVAELPGLRAKLTGELAAGCLR